MKLLQYVLIIFLTIVILNASDSRIESVQFFSNALGIQKTMHVYLPQDYDQDTERYPVLYLLRGHENEWINPNEDNSRSGRTIKILMDQLYASGDIGKMIVVMPGVMSSDHAFHGCGVNMIAPQFTGGAAGIGTGKFEDMLVQEIIPGVDSNYRTLNDRSQRGIDGFSLGGYMSMMFASRYPDLFISVGAYDGTLMWLDFDAPYNPAPWDDHWMHNSYFDAAFGVPRDTSYIWSHNPANNIYYADSTRIALFRQMQFLLHSASPPGSNHDETMHNLALLDDYGITNAFDPVILEPGAQHNWWYADEHMLQSLPLHWQKFQNPDSSNTNLQILAPLAGAVVSGTLNISWQNDPVPGTARIIIAASRDDGLSWRPLDTVNAGSNQYQWNTTLVEDGTLYKLRLWLSGDSAFAVAYSARFTVNNPGNGKPDLLIIAPQRHQTLNGQQTVQWYAADPDGDALQVSLKYSTDGGAQWRPLTIDPGNSGQYSWNTPVFPNSDNYSLKLTTGDGEFTASDSVGPFEIFNQRITVTDSLIAHLSGNGSGFVQIHIVDQDSLTGASYRITFDDSSFGHTVYNVIDQNSGQTLVQNAEELDGISEGPYFDGMRLVIRNYAQTEIDLQRSRWTTGNSTYDVSIYLPEIDMGTHILYGVPYPADYLVRIYGQVVDTSSSAFGAVPVPMKFRIINLTESRDAEVIFLDNDADNQFSIHDELYLVEQEIGAGPILTWALAVGGESAAIPPVSGDEFTIFSLKPFTSLDVFAFENITPIEEHISRTPLQFALYQNYPNPFNPQTTIPFEIGNQQHLNIKIYNILGQEIYELINESLPAGRYQITWNGINRYGRKMGSGIYFVLMKGPEFTKTSKIILLK